MRRRPKGTSAASGRAMLWKLVSPYKGRMVILAVVSLVSALLEASFIVLLTAIALALVEGQPSVGPVAGITLSNSGALGAAGVVLLMRVLFSILAVRVSVHLTADVTTHLRRQLSHAYLRTSWEIQHSEPPGRLQELLTAFVGSSTLAVQTITQAMTAGLSLIAFLGSGFLLDPVSTGAVLLMLGVVSIVLLPLRRAIRRRSAREAEARVAFAGSVAEYGALGMEMQTFGAEESFEASIDRLTLEASVAQRRTGVLMGIMPHVYITLAYTAVLAGVAVLSSVQVSNFAVLGAILLLMLRSISYGQQLSIASTATISRLPFLEQVEAAHAKYLAAQRAPGGQRPTSVAPLTLKDVGFGYTPDRIALDGVDLQVRSGEALGVIGPSGAGKSTLAQLLLGLRSPSRGSIKVQDLELQAVDRDWWTEHVTFVPQDALLFTGTVAENIRFFRSGIDDERLRDSASKANILKDIEALPAGFDTHLGQRGSQLSGGQKQRLSIARALAGKPELLILDEPTSALDGQSEALIRDTLAQLKGEITIVIIAHRMSTLDICDRILVIEDGQVSALGTPQDLRRESDFYRRALAVAGII